MIGFIDDHRGAYGVEPICRVLPIAPHRGGLVHSSDRGSQYVPIKYTERLANAGIEPSIGSVGDSYDNVGRDDPRPLQGRGHSSTCAVAIV